MTETYGKSTVITDHMGGSVDIRAEVTIDWSALVYELAKKAYLNKSKSSKLAVGVKLRIVDAKLRV